MSVCVCGGGGGHNNNKNLDLWPSGDEHLAGFTPREQCYRQTATPNSICSQGHTQPVTSMEGETR